MTIYLGTNRMLFLGTPFTDCNLVHGLWSRRRLQRHDPKWDEPSTRHFFQSHTSRGV